MALVTKDETKKRPPWRGLVFGGVAAVLFIFVLAVVAWLTRDTPKGVPPHEDPDAGFPDAGFPDAGPDDAGPSTGDVVAAADDAGAADGGVVADAGERIGPAVEPDAGRVTGVGVAGPPVDAGEVAALTAPVVEKCLKDALRFDPALGGKAVVHAIAARGGLSMTMPAAPSPVLASCVADKGKLGYASAPLEPAGVDVHVTLDGLRGTVTVTAADIVAP